MRIISFRDRDGLHLGQVVGDQVHLIAGSTIDADTDVAALLAGAGVASETRPLASVVPAPVSSPRRIVCVGLNYLAHIEETQRELPTYPVLFTKFASSLIGARDSIPVPPETDAVDYEGELAVIIGRPGRRIAQANAMDHVLGYSVANDVTMRDFQYRTHQWLQGKAWDGSTPIGPWLITPDEIDLEGQTLTTTLNGTVVQSSGLDRLIFPVAQLISTVSEFTRLETGDVILTGTPGGVGHRRDPKLYLRPGDVVEVEISGVGAVRNMVRAEVADATSVTQSLEAHTHNRADPIS